MFTASIMQHNKHYIEVDDMGRIISTWSDGPNPEKDTSNAICINNQGGYQFRFSPAGEENPQIYTMDMIPMYKWENNVVVKRADEEIENDRNAREVNPE